ncbi:glycosyltransferase family 2 protein [Flavobacterium psychrotolerans]|uniref:Glycosyltransferase family 2 protein n=1 Tax=Flavobacterium psychrotolerans TaxID=2169410 RepID=A0A2U1JFY3_9FLAO|nr:glycosyltransferase family 2 protein [Flavobacterium psychrotolerans]PWA04041.1 glycosyltransferase family 2 protein [Flavobacterium psychrotolerans]
MSKIPKVTIIMATYNRAHFIVDTLQSIKNQSFTDWECLIIDDGGTDNTREVIAPLLAQDSRFQFLKREAPYKKGLPGCRNFGLDLAKGNYIIFFDDDDFVHPANLKISLEAFEDSSIDFCNYQKCAYQGEMPAISTTAFAIEQKLTKADIAKVVTQEIGLASCTVLWKKHCFDTIRFNEKLLYAEEWECYIRIIAKNFKGIILSNVLYYNRKHAESNTGEFYRDNPIRRASYVEAVLMVMQNLKEKQLLTESLRRHFISLSIDFKEYDLFGQIMAILKLSVLQRVKWQFFYSTFPLRLSVYKFKKSIKKG